jgi:Fe-S cluster biogenesis protein NfuA
METVEGKIKAVLAKINQEIGEPEALEYDGFEKGVLRVRPGGHCLSCKLLLFVLKKGIFETINENVPEVRQVIAIESSFSESLCDGCKLPLEECQCTCQYCGKTEDCQCVIGYGTATGG